MYVSYMKKIWAIKLWYLVFKILPLSGLDNILFSAGKDKDFQSQAIFIFASLSSHFKIHNQS